MGCPQTGQVIAAASLIVSAHSAGFAALPAADGCPVGREREGFPLAGLAFFVRTEHVYIVNERGEDVKPLVLENLRNQGDAVPDVDQQGADQGQHLTDELVEGDSESEDDERLHASYYTVFIGRCQAVALCFFEKLCGSVGRPREVKVAERILAP